MKKIFSISVLIFFAGFISLSYINVSDERACFELETEIVSNTIEITFLDDTKVEGILNVYIHDEEMGYETSSYSEFTGKLTGEELIVDLVIEIEGNTEYETVTWIYKGDKIMIDNEVYIQVDCSE